MRRRQFAVILTASATTAVAGCLGATDEREAWYAHRLPGDTRTSFAAVELKPETRSDTTPSLTPIVFPRTSSGNQQSKGTLDVEVSELTDTDDLLVAYPLTVGVERMTRSSVELAAAGLYPLVQTPEKFSSVPRRILTTDQTTVVTGEFDRQELADRLTAETLLTTQYERSRQGQGFDQYAPIDSPDPVKTPPMVAVSEDAVVTAQTTTQLDRTIAVTTDARPSIVDANETAAWLVEQAGTADLVVGTIGPTSTEVADTAADNTPSADAEFRPTADQNVIAALNVGSGTDTTAQFALDTDSLNSETREMIQTRFGTTGRERERDISPARVTVRASYDTDEISVDFAEEDPDDGRKQLSKSTARALVPVDGLEFWYVPPVSRDIGVFWVETVADTEATALQVRTGLTGADGSEVQPKDPPITAGVRLAAPVNPDGDTMTVLAVNDENAIGAVTSKQAPTDELSDQTVGRVVPSDAFSFQYEPPDTGTVGVLSVIVEKQLEIEVLVVRGIADGVSKRAGALNSNSYINSGRRLEIPVDAENPGAVVFASVDGATGEVARWSGPPSSD